MFRCHTVVLRDGLQRPDLAVGDGMYKSIDAGTTWAHLGLRDAQQIGAVLVDPKDPNRVFVAALDHPYGPNTERGGGRLQPADRGQSALLPQRHDRIDARRSIVPQPAKGAALGIPSGPPSAGSRCWFWRAPRA